MSADVFISYAAKDRDRVALLVEGLQQAGVSVWIDMAGIEVAAMWSREIVSAIRECKVLLLSISPHSTESENVVKELALASERKKTIIPIYLEPAEIPETMEYQLAGIQRVEFFEGREDLALQAVIRALSKLGVTVADEASAAAAGASNIAAHGAGHSSGKAETKREVAVWLKAAATVAGLAVLGMAGTFFFGSSTTTAPMPIAVDPAQTNTTAQATLDTNRVVVLPFKVIGGAQDSADLGYGLVSTLTSKLQPLQNLVVIANESARKFKDSDQSPNEIGQALQVGTIVTGEIQTSGDKVQVNIRMIDANTEALGWGSTFTKTKDEFLDLQNEIATRLASELKGGLDAAEAQQLAQKATENQVAQAEYQAGRREWNKRSKSGFDNAIKHFERAIQLDPTYADPYVGLADTYLLYPFYNFGAPEVVVPKAKEYAQKAIDLNSNTAGAYTSLAVILYTYEHEWEFAEENFEKAIQLNPNYPTGHHWYGMYLIHMGRADEAIPLLIKGTQLDPKAIVIKNGLSIAYWCAGQKQMAQKTVETQFQVDPYFPPGLHTKYGMFLADTSENAVIHLTEAKKIYPTQPLIQWSLSNVHWARGDHELAKDQLLELHARFNDSFSKARFAELYFVMGKEEIAYELLEKSVKAKGVPVYFTAVIPSMKKYQSQPRFRKLFREINHPLYIDK